MGFARLKDSLLDRSIYFSFDRTGFERHAKRFDPADLDVDLTGRRCLVTGANSGLGKATALALAPLGAAVWLLCRSEERGTAAQGDIETATGTAPRLEIVDVASRASVGGFVERLGDLPVHVLVHNAGILPDTRRETEDGLEATWATNVMGPFLLTWLLAPNLRLGANDGGARVINITSGGMYTQKLDLDDVDWLERKFDGVTAYAQTKRAEVILTELWADRFAGTGVDVNSMHPGWADTPAVQQSLPRFWRFTRDRLRSPRQGSDTIVYLAAAPRLRGTTGAFFFDRRPAPTHAFPWTRERAADRRELWLLCSRQAGVDGCPLDRNLPPGDTP
ncbi:MAG: SDR family NAD(P)-dependent oxidoreductase [Acidobacteriota bacterium]